MNKNKQKGMRGEYEIRDLLQPYVDMVYKGFDVDEELIPKLRRNVDQIREGGADLEGINWIALEVKRVEQDNLYHMNEWWEQCKRSAAHKVNGIPITGEFDREPVLVWRKNKSPWNVRMFGYLLVIENPNAARVRTPVDISMEAFLEWFKIRLMSELNKRFVRGEIEIFHKGRSSARTGENLPNDPEQILLWTAQKERQYMLHEHAIGPVEVKEQPPKIIEKKYKAPWEQ